MYTFIPPKSVHFYTAVDTGDEHERGVVEDLTAAEKRIRKLLHLTGICGMCGEICGWNLKALESIEQSFQDELTSFNISVI